MLVLALVFSASVVAGLARRTHSIADQIHEELSIPRSWTLDDVVQSSQDYPLDALAVYLLAAGHNLGNRRASSRQTNADVFARRTYDRRDTLERLRGGGDVRTARHGFLYSLRRLLFPGNPPRERSSEFEQALKSGGKVGKGTQPSQTRQTINRSGLNRRSAGGRSQGGSVKKVHSKKDLDAILKSTPSRQLVVLDFFATWCGPCKQIAPVFESLAAANPHVTFVKIDVDECKDLQSEYGVSSMPTFKFLRGGTEVASMNGADEAGLREKVQGLAGKPTPWAGAGVGRKL